MVNANSGLVDLIDLNDVAAPEQNDVLDLGLDIASAIASVTSADEVGAANSVSVSGDTVAVAVEADTKQDNGFIAFYKTTGDFLTAVEVGALPDMVIFTPDGNKVLVANEGEPNGDYSNDPEGTVSIIDVSGGAASVTQANVITVSFTDFNAGGARAVELGDDVRVSSHRISDSSRYTFDKSPYRHSR